MKTLSIKQEAQKIVEGLRDDSSWGDLMYEIYVRREIELGLQDIQAGRIVEMDEVKRRFGISE